MKLDEVAWVGDENGEDFYKVGIYLCTRIKENGFGQFVGAKRAGNFLIFCSFCVDTANLRL